MISCCSRRAFLQAGTVGASAVALASCGGGAGEEEQSRRWVSIELDQHLNVGESTSVAHQDEQLLVHRPSEEEVLVFSAVCPHQGCTVGVAEEHFECPCHGSRFELTGQWQSGPAEQPLHEFQAQLEGTSLRVLL